MLDFHGFPLWNQMPRIEDLSGSGAWKKAEKSLLQLSCSRDDFMGMEPEDFHGARTGRLPQRLCARPFLAAIGLRNSQRAVGRIGTEARTVVALEFHFENQHGIGWEFSHGSTSTAQFVGDIGLPAVADVHFLQYGGEAHYGVADQQTCRLGKIRVEDIFDAAVGAGVVEDETLGIGRRRMQSAQVVDADGVRILWAAAACTLADDLHADRVSGLTFGFGCLGKGTEGAPFAMLFPVAAISCLGSGNCLVGMAEDGFERCVVGGFPVHEFFVVGDVLFAGRQSREGNDTTEQQKVLEVLLHKLGHGPVIASPEGSTGEKKTGRVPARAPLPGKIIYLLICFKREVMLTLSSIKLRKSLILTRCCSIVSRSRSVTQLSLSVSWSMVIQ